MSKKSFPEDFQSYKVIKTFSKLRAIDARAFVTNDPNEWFINVLYYKRRSGEVKDIEIIIQKDVKEWTNWLINLGWKED